MVGGATAMHVISYSPWTSRISWKNTRNHFNMFCFILLSRAVEVNLDDDGKLSRAATIISHWSHPFILHISMPLSILRSSSISILNIHRPSSHRPNTTFHHRILKEQERRKSSTRFEFRPAVYLLATIIVCLPDSSTLSLRHLSLSSLAITK